VLAEPTAFRERKPPPRPQSHGASFSLEETYGTSLLAAAATNDFTEGIVFHDRTYYYHVF